MKYLFILPLNPHLFEDEEVGGETVVETEGTDNLESGESQAPQLTEDSYRTFKEQYKDFYDNDVQTIVKKRLGDTKKQEAEFQDLRTKYDSQKEIYDILTEKYGVNDTAQLKQMIENELIEKMAYDKDVNPEFIKQTREQQRLAKEQQAEIAKLRGENESFVRQQEAMKKAREWQEEAETLVQEYPDFKLTSWAENDLFMTMLRNGFTVKNAYEAADIENVKKMASQKSEKLTADNIRAGKRPKENATGKTSTSSIKKSISEMTSAEIKDIERRVLNGEVVSF